MGRITKCKAPLIALGNLEWETLRDIYAPTVNAKTINLMLALSVQERMIFCGLDDVTGTFLNADTGETVHIELPERLRPKTPAGEGTSMTSQEDTVWFEQGTKGILRRRRGNPLPCTWISVITHRCSNTSALGCSCLAAPALSCSDPAPAPSNLALNPGAQSPVALGALRASLVASLVLDGSGVIGHSSARCRSLLKDQSTPARPARL